MSSLETVSFAVRSAVQHFNWTEAQLFATGKLWLLGWDEHLNDVALCILAIVYWNASQTLQVCVFYLMLWWRVPYVVSKVVHLWLHLYRWSLGLTAGHRCTLTCTVKNWNHWSWKFAAGANRRQSGKRYVCLKAIFVCRGIISNNLCIRWKEHVSLYIIDAFMELRLRCQHNITILVSKSRNFNFEYFEYKKVLTFHVLNRLFSSKSQILHNISTNILLLDWT